MLCFFYVHSKFIFPQFHFAFLNSRNSLCEWSSISSSLCPSGRFIHLGCPDNLTHDKAMEFEILKNILASLVSVVTLMFMLFRYLHKRDVSNAKLIADTIRDATQKAFQVSHIESRVREIEDIQAENTKAIQDLNNSLNKRLDQLFIAIANIKGNHND